MADADTSDFEQFITGRIDFTTGTPSTGDTGDFEQWLTVRLDLAEYVVAPAGDIKQIATIDWASVKAIGTVAEASIKQIATISAN